MDNRGKVEIGSPIWIEKQREIRQASADEYEFYERSGHNYPAALDALEASNAREAEKDATIFRLTAERDGGHDGC